MVKETLKKKMIKDLVCAYSQEIVFPLPASIFFNEILKYFYK